MSRTLALLRFYLGAHGTRDLPVAALLLPAALSGTLALLLRFDVTPFAFSVCALTVTGLMVAVPLLGELGYLLRADPSSEWVEALPVAPREVRAARALHLVVTLAVLTVGTLAPAAALAPPDMTLAARAGLVACGLGLATALAAVLLLLQAILGGRAESLFVLLQTLLVTTVVLGVVLGLRHVHVIADVEQWTDGGLTAFPPAWFAAPLGAGAGVLELLLALGLGAASLAVVLFLPRPVAPRRVGSTGITDRLLAPARALATRFWVAADERASFDLVYDAVPREREFVLRSYPMVGIPLAFLLAASSGDAGADRDGLLALLLFTPGVYLPILLSQLPASQSHEARWLLEGAPTTAGALHNGAFKALAVRFLLPLYLVLALLAASWSESGPAFALRLALPGALVSLAVMRRLYDLCVTELPLSVAPDRLRTNLDWGGQLMGVAVVLTILAVGANLFLGPVAAVVACGVLVGLEFRAGRALRARSG